MGLPIFQGISRERLSDIIDKTPFHFQKFADGEKIAEAGDLCTHIRFIISGDARLVTAGRNRKVSVSETLSSPAVLGPEYLFGLDTKVPFTATAKGVCGILQISKADYVNILQSDKVSLFNAMNILSRQSQINTSNLLALSSGSIAERLSYLVLSLTHQNAKDITVTFKQKDLCAILGSQRTSLISALSKLADDGVIEFGTSEIRINDRRELLSILHSGE